MQPMRTHMRAVLCLPNCGATLTKHVKYRDRVTINMLLKVASGAFHSHGLLACYDTTFYTRRAGYR